MYNEWSPIPLTIINFAQVLAHMVECVAINHVVVCSIATNCTQHEWYNNVYILTIHIVQSKNDEMML